MYITFLNDNIELLPVICKTSFYYYMDYWKHYMDIHSPKELELVYINKFLSKHTLIKNNMYTLFTDDTKTQFIGFGSTLDNDFKNYIKKDTNGIFLSDLFIFEKYRNKGYASMVINYIITNIRIKNNNIPIYISVENNETLHIFYKKMGFIIINTFVAERTYTIFEYVGISKL